MCNHTKTTLVHPFTPLLIFLLSIAPSLSLNFDGTLLLSFKYSILNDPLSVLDNWDYNDRTPCFWTGVTCAVVQTPFGTPDMFRVVALTLPNSQLAGIIPEDLGLIPHLRTLDLSRNFFNGTLPNSLFNASELQVLLLSGNLLSGVIPEFDAKSGIKVVNLSANALSGNVPHSIVSMKNLSVVSLRGNRLSGPVPSGIDSIQVMDLSSNLFNGSLPDAFGGANLNYLNFSSNKLSGLVPPLFASRIPANASIDLSFNDLSGAIPESESLGNQNSQAFAGNGDLCGKPLQKLCTIPSTFSNPPNDKTANGTASPAIAAIPKTITSTPLVNSPDGGTTTTAARIAPQQGGLKAGTIAGIAVVPLAAVGVLAAVALFIHQRRKRQNSLAKQDQGKAIHVHEYKHDPEASAVVKEARGLPTWPCLSLTNGEESSEITTSDSDGNSSCSTDHREKAKNEKSLVMVDGDMQLELETLFKASAYVLASSGPSIVYKAVLRDGTALAVRRIGEAGVGKMKEFESQVKAIAKLRHQNIVRLRGFYWGDDEKLMIYDYIPNGSLANVGFKKVASSPYHLPFETRLKIAKGVARGLHYIHERKNAHGNIKPSNILLTQEMDPVISDFGLHMLIHGKHGHKSDGGTRHFGSYRSTSHQSDDLHDQQVNGSPCIAPTGFIGCTSPYHAPESLKKHKPNPKWDVYSYGILLLEILTGKVFSDRELSQWNATIVAEDHSRVMRMADVAIRGDVAGREEAIVAWFKLGLSCASLVPQKRPSMKDALGVLEKLPSCSY